MNILSNCLKDYEIIKAKRYYFIDISDISDISMKLKNTAPKSEPVLVEK